ncbi:similar to Saccharomyces cerevisiae YPR095C SYT1 Guanine nucleotide exchange factor (GEF) for Arf proteins [Maudiozyma saulgeensis]|uniref:Similar to Saccharomyces cerevisiae YPR095C SYT1 Guanine nucleotide exchange factor (GEF) for Arf proteins n=1 Tax=Maudiozyma saulgeensis TaxID=1789683 RepID=A0A1X7QY82_9SACH|nr:similar to Saccharomyces cerevisiae YPR095C SYT1 Guanine nucleotide exchange factor (GEF) for Arf proteins [Kazachstania saulgeensis]
MSQSITSRIKSKLFQGNNDSDNDNNNNNNDTDKEGTKNSNFDKHSNRIGSLPTMDFTVHTNESSELNPITETNSTRSETPITNNTDTTPTEENNKDDGTTVNTKHNPKQNPNSRIRRLKNKVFDMNFRPSRSVSKETVPKTSEQSKTTSTPKDSSDGDIVPMELQIPKNTTTAARNSFSKSPRRRSLEKFPIKDNVPHNYDEMYRTFSETSACSSQDTNIKPRRHHSRHQSSILPMKKITSENTSSGSPPFRLYNVTALRHLRSNDDNIELPKYPAEEEHKTLGLPNQSKSITRRRSKTVDAYDTLKKSRTPPAIQLRMPGTARVSRSNSFKLNESRNKNDNNEEYSSAKPYPPPSPERLSTFGGPLTRRSTETTNTKPYSNHNTPSLQSNTNSTFSISRRSNSIVNALSSFVNLRSGSGSSSKAPHFQNYNFQPENTVPVKLSDLPTPPMYKENEPYDSYLKRLSGYGKFVSVILTEKPDGYKLGCLKFFLIEYFDFAMDPLDIALRKLLIFLELPKEAQQIDRLLTEFAKVYYDKQKSYYGTNCPWTNYNQVYFVIFSLLMLHTDYFNANNKQKMTRQEFTKLVHEDTYSEGDKVPLEILAYYYGNIVAKESPKFDFSTYYSMLSPSTPSSIEFTYSENNSSEGASKTSLLPYNATNALIQTNTEHVTDTIEDNVNKENYKTTAVMDENDGIIYSPKAIIEQNKLFNSRRTSYNSNNTAGDIDDTAINALTQDYTPPLTFKGRPSSNSISSYFSNSNMTPTPIPSSNTFATLTPGGAVGNPFLSSHKQGGISSAETKDDIDIYYHIFNDDLFEISMTLQVVKLMPHDFSTYNVMPKHKEENKYKKYYDILKEFKGAYLRIPKNHISKLNIPNYEIINPSEPSNNQLLKSKPKYYYLKIIRMGEIEELSSNNSWRSKTVLLTNCGILIYDSNKPGHHHTLIPSGSIFSDSSELFTTEVNRNDTTGESYYTVNFRSGFVMLFNDELYAETTKCESSYKSNDNSDNRNDEMNENDYAFLLWGTHGKSIWRCKNDLERSNWIDSINLLGCFHGTSNNYRCLNDTVACKETETISHRYYYWHIENQKIIEKFNSIERELILFKQSIPINSRTRNDMINNIVNLSKKVKRFIHDYRRNDCYNFIVDSLDLVKEVDPTDECESVIQTSAISDDRGFSFNEESLQKCFTENSRDNLDDLVEPLDGSSLHCA